MPHPMSPAKRLSTEMKDATKDALVILLLAAVSALSLAAVSWGTRLWVRKCRADAENPAQLRRIADALERAYPEWTPPLPRPSMIDAIPPMPETATNGYGLTKAQQEKIDRTPGCFDTFMLRNGVVYPEYCR